MVEISIREQVKRLVDLQKIDFEIYRFNKELVEKPAIVEELKAKFEEKKEKLGELEEKFKMEQVSRKNVELELKTKEDEMVKANSQLMALKTNKEYQAKLSEIENLKADKSIAEEKIILSYDSSDAINKDITTEKAVLTEEEKKFQEEKGKTDKEMKEIQEQLQLLENKRKQLTPEIDKTNLSRYERILRNKEGMAMVPIQGNACGGCYMNVPPQVINEVKMHDRLISCEMCTRLLYLEDDL